MRRHALLLVALAAGLGLLGCGSSPDRKAVADGAPASVPRDLASIPDAVPRDEPPSRYGNPPEYEVFGQRYRTLASSEGFEQRGLASWYGTKFHGRRTSSGEPYDMFAMTAAHRELPLPSFVEVTNLDNGRQVIVRVNDRGPFVAGRVIDLSYAAAYRLGVLERGVAPVHLRAVGPRDREPEPLHLAARSDAPYPSAGNGAESEDDQFIQVGAFASHMAAERVQSDLRDLGFDAVRITTLEAANGILHRVRIGPLADALAVQEATERLHQAALTDYRVVAE
ncbi:septal ring lytic transglycosylase RlpA family protein [Thioalkalivibrio paradoxus]|uniref:Endolytic peptidoglycan transglycosylase RlpA n=1 Tax=Thioalkalivibrio paradoxus ARh 1 TaxID=713585 RepID=W0DH19_9GAMM|nr:septal ring lytic transglycosylase RlpA family protein [Thioalkalivibrio paradoxus]AHE97934.1 rare lipoprotein A [Thioalkalivibrio paradoxus ARh 1]